MMNATRMFEGLAVQSLLGAHYASVFRFADDFGSYDARVAPDVSSTDINFAALDNGIVLHLTEEGAPEVRAFRNPGAVARLFHAGAQAYFARGPRLYKFNLRRRP